MSGQLAWLGKAFPRGIQERGVTTRALISGTGGVWEVLYELAEHIGLKEREWTGLQKMGLKVLLQKPDGQKERSPIQFLTAGKSVLVIQEVRQRECVWTNPCKSFRSDPSSENQCSH